MSEKEKSEMVPKSSGNLFSFDEFDEFFNQFMSRKWPRMFEWNVAKDFEKNFPKVDMIDHEQEIEIQAALPGVNKEDLEVSVTGQAVSIKTSSKKEEKKEEKRYYRREIMRGEFQRSLALPENVDSDHAKATFKDGILKITIPKTQKNHRKSVEIK